MKMTHFTPSSHQLHLPTPFVMLLSVRYLFLFQIFFRRKRERERDVMTKIFNASVENNYSSYWQAILVRDFGNLEGGGVGGRVDVFVP